MENAEEKAEREHRRSESLLVNILPSRIAERLKDTPNSQVPDAYAEAGFTARTTDTTPTQLVCFLNDVYSRLDTLVERHGLEKIKTSGDAYMVVSGVPEPRPDHAATLAALALDMREAFGGLVDPKGRPVPVRIGIASGPVVAGVVGIRKFFYDVWGDAVNFASRMESTGEAGKIQVARLRPGNCSPIASIWSRARRHRCAWEGADADMVPDRRKAGGHDCRGQNERVLTIPQAAGPPAAPRCC